LPGRQFVDAGRHARCHEEFDPRETVETIGREKITGRRHGSDGVPHAASEIKAPLALRSLRRDRVTGEFPVELKQQFSRAASDVRGIVLR